jgi:type IV secretory pathway VirB3-like protein
MAASHGPVVLRSVAAPPKLLYASVPLVKAEGAICMLVGLFTLEPMMAMVLFAFLHMAAVILTRRDPFFIEVMQARFRCKRTHNLRPVKGHRYVA